MGVVLGTIILSGCSGPENGPSGVQLSDSSCAQLRSELNALDRRGVPSLIESKAAGRSRFSAQQESDMEHYHRALDSYLGGQCASDARYKARRGRG
jgi:hypothetical protein